MSITFDIWGLIAFGIGFWILMDGLIFGLMPALVRQMLLQMRDISADDLRIAGLASASIGAVIVYAVISF
jgi:uncharacterized protein YjeT (DUF2065 family)